MVDVASIETFDNELTREAEILTDLESFFINILGGEVFCDAAIIGIAELYLVFFVVKEIVYIHIVNVPLNTLKIHI
jgi:hypothetical protein